TVRSVTLGSCVPASLSPGFGETGPTRRYLCSFSNACPFLLSSFPLPFTRSSGFLLSPFSFDLSSLSSPLPPFRTCPLARAARLSGRCRRAVVRATDAPVRCHRLTHCAGGAVVADMGSRSSREEPRGDTIRPVPVHPASAVCGVVADGTWS